MKSVILAGVAAIAVASSVSAVAQDAQESVGGIQDIIVTAQKRAENLQDTPLAVSALTTETIEARSITNIGNLGSMAPSLVVSPAAGAPNNVVLFIRGLGNGEPLLTADSPVGIYVDGIILARSAGSAFEIADLERIEVLRGPQGTLYGRNTIGGAINLVTRKPGETFGLQQKLSVGNYEYLYSRTTLDTGELGDSGLKASFTYLHKQRNGVTDNIKEPNKRDPGAYRTDAVRAVLAYDKQAGIRATYSYDYNNNRAYSNAFQLTAARPDLFSFFAASPGAGGGVFTVSPDKKLKRISLDADGKTIDRIEAHTLTLEADLGESLTIKSLTGYRKWTQKVVESTFGGNADLLGTIVGRGPTLYPVSLYQAAGVRHQDQWSEEINLIGKVGEALDYVVGGYFFSEKGNEVNPQKVGFVTPNGVFPTTPMLTYSAKSRSTAVFGQATWHITDRLDLTGGLRYTWDKKWLEQVEPDVRSLVASFSKFNWAATLDYKFTDDTMGYARIATGYKAGGFSARSLDRGFKPENLTSYEIGLKTDLFDRRLRLNATAYYADHKDVQINSFQATQGGASAVVTNAGKARYQGVEFEVTAAPFAGLTTYATVGYLDRKFKKFDIFNTAANTLGYPVGVNVDIADIAKFVYSASTTVNAGVEYEFGSLDFGKLKARLDYNYRSKVYFSPNPLLSPFMENVAAPARGLFDARLTLSEIPMQTGQASISLWGKNILNKDYKAVGIDFGGMGFAGNVYGDPATWGIDLRFQF